MRTRSLFLLTLTLLAIAVFLALGIWQMERRSWKLDLIARVERHIAQPATPAPNPMEWPALNEHDDAYRHVTVRGQFLHDYETYVQAVTAQGPGFWVLTPLRTAEGYIILINRGFVPPEKRDIPHRDEVLTDDVVSVTGLLRMNEPKGRFMRANVPADDRWYSRDVYAIAGKHSLLHVAPYFIDADATPNAGGYPLGGLTVVSFYNQHLVYALSWFAMALGLGLRTVTALGLHRRVSLRAFTGRSGYGRAMEISTAIEHTTNRKNLLQLLYLRGIAIAGQLATILIVRYGFQITLPMSTMLGVIGCLVLLNIVSFYRYRAGTQITSTELLVELLLDAAALTAQLHLSGGAANPFVSLFLLQVIIGAILLSPRYAWTLFAATFACYVALTFHAHTLEPLYPPHLSEHFNLPILGMLISYTLAAFLLVFFITKISANLKERDTLLARLKQQSLEEEHVVRIGLLAAGAAHELGTPLTTISVILKDLQSLPAPESKAELNEDIATMQRELERCKNIVSGILLSSGQVRGEGAKITGLRAFMTATVADWNASRAPDWLDYRYNAADMPIVSDTVLRQMLFNLLDNAVEASPTWVGIDITSNETTLTVRVEDHGVGFSNEAIRNFGTPYASSKGGHGRGLGLFLVANTLRKLGGEAQASNTETGAMVTLTIPLAAIRSEKP